MTVVDNILGREVPPNSDSWQMFPGERLMLEKILSESNCKHYLEIGVWYGGSLCLAAKYCQKVTGIDIDPEVSTRFTIPPNADLLIGNSTELLIDLLQNQNEAPGVILIDGDHSFSQVYSDLSIIANHVTRQTLVLTHDTGHNSVRSAIKKGFEDNPNIIDLDLDLVPGRIIMSGGGVGEIWGGLGIMLINPKSEEGFASVRSIESTADTMFAKLEILDSKRHSKIKISKLSKNRMLLNRSKFVENLKSFYGRILN